MYIKEKIVIAGLYVHILTIKYWKCETIPVKDLKKNYL